MLNSLETEKQDKAKRVANNIRLLSNKQEGTQKIVEARASIGNQLPTTYTADVGGNGVFVEPTVRGGKRRTKKMKLSKRKTKKLKK